MNKLAKKFLVVMFLIFALCVSSTNAFADSGRSRGRDRHAKGRDDHRGRQVVMVKNNHYYYHNGRFLRPGWFGFRVAINSPLVIGAVVSYLPAGHRTVIVRGSTYHCHNNIYYKPCSSGYMVVSAPF